MSALFGRPWRLVGGDAAVLTFDEARALGARVSKMVSADQVSVIITHTVRQTTRITNNRVLSADHGNDLSLTIRVGYGDGNKDSIISGNQVDDATVMALVRRAESVARATLGSPYKSRQKVPLGPQQYLPVQLWRDASIAALSERPAVVADIIDVVRSAGLVASGFVGIIARSQYVMNRDEGTEAYCRETDCECTVGARTPDGSASGWDGRANRDWSRIDPHAVAARAVELAKQSVQPVAVEPGRRTVILSPVAVAQLVYIMGIAYDAFRTDSGLTPFSKKPTPNAMASDADMADSAPLLSKLGLRVFDRRLTISSDPDDADGGFAPFFSIGFPQPRMTWVENGVLKNLAYDPNYAMAHGKAWADWPRTFRITGGPTTIEEMIASCDEGIYVNRISEVAQLNQFTGLETGVTRDGCFLVKHGKIDRPVRNFRLVDSPWFFLNNILALGEPVRAAFGYTPGADGTGWPRPPMIVPPIMVRDFSFTALANAV